MWSHTISRIEHEGSNLIFYSSDYNRWSSDTSFYLEPKYITLVNELFRRFGFDTYDQVRMFEFKSMKDRFDEAVALLIYGSKILTPDELLLTVIVPALQSGIQPLWRSIADSSIKAYYQQEKDTGRIVNNEYCLIGDRWIAYMQKLLPDQIILACNPPTNQVGNIAFYFKIVTGDRIDTWGFYPSYQLLTLCQA